MHYGIPIQVFEYETLRIGDRGFKDHHWTAIGEYNARFEGQFFQLLPHGIRFLNYVGVIQVCDITIEILPKIDREVFETDKKTCQSALIDMLRYCHWMKVHAGETASLKFKPNSILEAYLELFLSACETILHQGLVKKYRKNSGQVKSLKGKLEFSRNISHNLVRKDRFYTTHTVYDRDNVFNRILYKALKVIPQISNSPFLKDRLYSLLLDWPEVGDVKVSEEFFQRLTYDRKTQGYKEAIQIAAMILLNFRPDVIHGRNHVLAILFDMNELWEEYVYRMLLKTSGNEWTIVAQDHKPFWQQKDAKYSKSIRPDLVLTRQPEGSEIKETTYIVDTKWKVPELGAPGDADLKQMFVYNEYWESNWAILLYPSNENKTEKSFEKGQFHSHDGKDIKHNCGLMRVSVITEGKLNTEIGTQILNVIKTECKIG